MYKHFLAVLIIFFAYSVDAADLVEVMGNVRADKAPVYSEPSTKGRVVSSMTKNSKVVITSKDGEWVKILLFNNEYGYMHTSDVELKYENITKSESESKILIDIANLLAQFNDTVQSSWFAEKQKIVPSLSFLGGRAADEIDLMYASVNNKGDAVPSLKENPLQKDMVKLLELIYMKMIVLSYDRYTITIKTPDFNAGTYRGRTSDYAVLTLQKNYANLEDIKNGTGSIWDYVRSAKKPEDLFKDYPH